MNGEAMVSIVLLLILFTASKAQITSNAIVRLETLLTETPGGDAAAVGCKIDQFLENCVANHIRGVSVELKRSDVNMDAASPQLGHLYFESPHANTAVYTGKGYHESFLFDLLSKLRAEGIKTYAWWPTFNDAVLARANPADALHTRFDFGSTDPSDLIVSDQFVSVHSDAVRQHQLDMLNEILTHPSMSGWDGVRLDYIRFNYDEDDFSMAARTKYIELHDSDPLHSVSSKFDQHWISFRRDEITDFLQEATTQCHNVDSNLDVGGYVLPFPAHPGGFDTFPGQGNDFTQYHPFGFRILPMIYWQDWASSRSFDSWTKEKVFYSVQYSTNSPPVWPTFSITNTQWCGTNETCHRQHVIKAFLTAANSGKEDVGYGSRTVEMFFYHEWNKVEWDRLSYALSTANEIISNGTAAPTPSPDPNDCTYFVPCGYKFHAGKDSPGNTLHISEPRNIPRITIDCDADPSCKGFNSFGHTKYEILDLNQWESWTLNPCLGLYVKESIITPGSRKSPSRTRNPTRSPIPLPSFPSTSSKSSKGSKSSKSSKGSKSSKSSKSGNPTSSCPYEVPDGYGFYPYKDSPGYAWGPFNWRDIPAIANDCNADSMCVAFNSNGWLKWHVLDQSEWETWTSDPCLGVYIKQTSERGGGLQFTEIPADIS